MVTGQIGMDKKPYLKTVAEMAGERGGRIDLFHVGNMMYGEARDVTKGRILDLPISRLISTQYCRTLETAVLAFGVPELILRTDLSNSLTDYLAAEPEAGTNVMIVAHIGTIRNAIGLDDTFEEGDSLVYRPDGNGGFDYIGRIGLYDWPILAQLNAN